MSTRKEESKMQRHLLIMVQHVIKIHAEKRVTSSWQGSINNALKYINKLKTGKECWDFEINELYEEAISYAAEEVRNGISIETLEALVDKEFVVLNCKVLLGVKLC